MSYCVRSIHDHCISDGSFTHRLRLLSAVKHLSPVKNENHLSELSVEGERDRILLDIFDISIFLEQFSCETRRSSHYDQTDFEL